MSEQVERADVLADVVRLHADYARLIDAREAQAWSLLFTEDGLLIREDKPPVEGRAQLVTFAAESPAGVHLPGLPTVEPQSDGSVIATAHFVFVNGATRRIVAGVYRDDLVRGGTGLVFRRRDIQAGALLDL